MNIHKICTIYINFVAGLEPMGFSKSNATVPLFISISEEDLGSQLVVHGDTDENLTLYKSPLKNRDGNAIFQLMPLQTFSNTELDTAGLQTLLCIKFVSNLSQALILVLVFYKKYEANSYRLVLRRKV